MNNKFKLNYKLNCGHEMMWFWSKVTDVLIKCAQYTHNRTKQQYQKNRETAKEMLNYDYSESYKKDLEDLVNSEIESD